MAYNLIMSQKLQKPLKYAFKILSYTFNICLFLIKKDPKRLNIWRHIYLLLMEIAYKVVRHTHFCLGE